MTPPIEACKMAATSWGSVASGSEEVRNIWTMALWNRVPICRTIFAPSMSELTEYRAALFLATFILA